MTDSRRAPKGLWIACTFIAIVIAILLRTTTPGDLWDDAQERTIAYTADMLAEGGVAWIVPHDMANDPPTKPPLINWITAPFVALFGVHATFAYKLPALLAHALVLAVVVRTGERLRPGVGWLAALMLVASYPVVKLAWLARPDAPMIAAAIVAWCAFTHAFAPDPRAMPDAFDRHALDRSRLGWLLLAWGASSIAWLAKGPAAIFIPIFALLAAWSTARHRGAHGTGSTWARRAARWAGAWWGLPLMVAPIAAWFVAVYVIDPAHAVERLLGAELSGRVAGTSDVMTERHGPWRIVLGAWRMPVYYLARFVPWSILAVIGAGLLLWRVRPRVLEPVRSILNRCVASARACAASWLRARPAGARRRAARRGRWIVAALRPTGDSGNGGIAAAPDDDRAARTHVLLMAILWSVVVVLAFAFVSGGRADYIAAAYPTAALVAAWWTLDAAPRWFTEAARWTVPTTVLILLASFWLSEARGGHLGRDVAVGFDRIARESVAHVRAAPAPAIGRTPAAQHLGTLIGAGRRGQSNAIELHAAIDEAIGSDAPLWILLSETIDLEPIHERLRAEPRARRVDRWTIDTSASPWVPSAVVLYRVIGSAD